MTNHEEELWELVNETVSDLDAIREALSRRYLLEVQELLNRTQERLVKFALRFEEAFTEDPGAS